MSLDTKYRPRTYDDVLGQRASVKVLKGLVSSGAGWRQSYLFAGPYGSGKTTLARILARALLCEKTNEGEPCDVCPSCVSMMEGGSSNFVEVDAATNSGKADVKKILEELDYSSFAGSKRLYLFDEAHQLSKDALDALLKPMEENSRGSLDKRLVVIFATTEPERMRQTVLSRCAPAFIIHHVKSEEIADRLEMVCEKEGYTSERDALMLIADISEGHIRDALKALEGVGSSNSGHVGVKAVRSYLHVDRNDVVCQILKEDHVKALELCDELVSNTPVGVAYDRLLAASMFAVEIGLGTSTPPPYWNRTFLKEAYDKYGLSLLGLADTLATRPGKGLTTALLKCDVIKWKLSGTNLSPPSVQNIPMGSVMTDKNERSYKAISENPINKVETNSEIGSKIVNDMSISAFSKRVREYITKRGGATDGKTEMGDIRTDG